MENFYSFECILLWKDLNIDFCTVIKRISTTTTAWQSVAVQLNNSTKCFTGGILLNFIPPLCFYVCSNKSTRILHWDFIFLWKRPSSANRKTRFMKTQRHTANHTQTWLTLMICVYAMNIHTIITCCSMLMFLYIFS